MRIETQDLNLFWKVWASVLDLPIKEQASVFESDYLGEGTVGLKDFWHLRIKSGEELALRIAAAPRYYNSLRDTCQEIPAQVQAIKNACCKLDELLCGANMPDVYLVIGCMNCAGTESDAGLLIGFDMFGRTDATPMDELGQWHREIVFRPNVLPPAVLHELVHANQRYAESDTLLAKSITEGAADFFVSLLLDPSTGSREAYGRQNESQIWRQFSSEMHDSDYRNWMYEGDGPKNRPADLGYFVGRQICAAYFARQSDPTQAAKDILTISDFTEFLRASSYDGEAPDVPRL